MLLIIPPYKDTEKSVQNSSNFTEDGRNKGQYNNICCMVESYG